MKKMRLTLLVENTAAGNGLLAEHGLSLWVETGSRQVLFDTGQADIVVHNTDILGVDLCPTDAIALSQGHYDHTGGLGKLLRKCGRKPVCMHGSCEGYYPEIFNS